MFSARVGSVSCMGTQKARSRWKELVGEGVYEKKMLVLQGMGVGARWRGSLGSLGQEVWGAAKIEIFTLS